MKLRLEQIYADLTRKLALVYAISGDELILIDELVQAIKRKAQQEGFDEIQQLNTELGFDWSAWLEGTQNSMLFSSRQIHLLRIHNGKPGDKGSAALQAYCANLHPDNLLIIICPKLDSSSLKTKWWMALDKAGVSAQIWPLEPAAQKTWFLNHLKQAQLSMEPAAADWLIEQTLGNLIACKDYLQQFSLLFTPGTQIKLGDLQESISDQAEFDLFKLVDACNLGDQKNCLRILQKLQAQGTEAILILWAMTRELRQVYQLQEKLRAGNSLEQLLRELYLPLPRTRPLQQATKRLTPSQIETLLVEAGHLDAAMKGMSPLPLWPSLVNWCLAYCERMP